jgi:dTDP-4-dehydrorhamnose reductase
VSPQPWIDGEALVLGARGMLGSDMVETLSRRAHHGPHRRPTAWDLPELDITARQDVADALTSLRPTVVINAAAFTDVDECETQVEQAMSVNAKAPGYIARACAELGAVCVHIGTDFIFDGTATDPYEPDDTPNPLSVYGRSKWEGEQAIRESGCEHLIVRTSWLFGPHGANFVEAILRQARLGATLRVVSDQVGCPTHAADLADAICRLLDVEARGTVHFANRGQCSRLEFAQAILQNAGLDTGVKPILSRTLAQPARRPPFSALSTQAYTNATGHRPTHWTDALARYMAAAHPRDEASVGAKTDPSGVDELGGRAGEP